MLKNSDMKKPTFWALASTLAATFAATLVATLSMTACIVDATIDGDKKTVDEGKPAVLSFQPQMGGHSATRAETYDQTYEDFAAFFAGAGADIFEGSGSTDPDRGTGRAADRRITTFRVLVYYGEGNTMGTKGDLVVYNGQPANHLFDWMEGDDKNSPPFEFELLTGTYDFVFVANDGGLLGADRSSTNCATMAELRTQKFTRGGGADGQIHSEDPIPMVSYFSGVDVETGSISFIDAAGRYGNKTPGAKATLTGTWGVWMERAAIRLSFGFHMGRGQFEAWSNHHGGTPLLYIDGLRSAGFVLPQSAMGGYAAASNGAAEYDMATQQHAAYNLASAAAIKPGKIMQNADGTYEVFFDRLVYPEHLPTDKADATKALRAYMYFRYEDQAARKEMLVQTGAGDCSLPRNTWVWTRANIFTDIDYRVKIVPWGDAGLDEVDILQNELKTDRSEFLFGASAASERVDVFTDRAEGWTIDPIAAADGWITVSPMKGNENKTTLTSVAVEQNTSGEIRSGTFTIRAGNLHRTIVVTQLPASGEIVDTTPANVRSYVGAFWKANQYGERLIRIVRPVADPVTAIDGAWAAYVIEGEDWIILDTKEPASEVTWSSDPATSGNDTGFDVAHRVSGYATSVSGELPAVAGSAIYFRIGLNGQYTPTEERPARYGVVLLVCGGASPKYRRIWIRQGEGADYLIEPGYDAANYPERTKENTFKFSPYNLTTTELSSTNQKVDLPARGGVFVDYPSQGGAFFQYANGNRTAFYHTVSAANWVTGTGAVWSDDLETCPEGWRRPKATIQGTDTQPTKPGEPAYSLLPKPDQATSGGRYNNANAAEGYYADGFFDRRGFSKGYVGVSTSDSQAASFGLVMFNNFSTDDHRNASIFFPYTGYLHEATGTGGGGSGTSANYWVSQNGARAIGLDAKGLNIFNNVTTPHGWGYSIRCVKEDTEATSGTFTVSQPADYLYSGETQPVTIVSLNEDGFTLPWQLHGYSLDDGATYSTIKPDWLTIPTRGNGGLPDQTIDVTVKPSVTVGGTNLVVRNTATLGLAVAPHDLSTRGGTQPRNTANCYVVNSPGFYKFPLVYGNAIKNGADNTPAYKNTGGTLSTFLNHAGNAISSPYINEQGVTPADAIVVWMDSPELVTNPRLVDSGQNQSLAFDINKETVAQGNAIVAVRDASGTILWSWHIWVAHYREVFDVSGAYSNTFDMEGANATYKVMKSNIGWVGNTMKSHPARKVTVKLRQLDTDKTATFTVNQPAGPSDNTIGRNPYFQWGRKDPMPPAKTNNNTDEITLFGSRVWANTSTVSGSMAESIQNPDKMYGTGSRWYEGTAYHNLWSATETKNSSGLASDNVTTNVKTIYDPSPAGFRVPVLDVFDALDDTNFVWYPLDGYNVRHYPDQASSYFLPASGQRDPYTGTPAGVATFGHYWVAFQASDDTGTYFRFSSSEISHTYSMGTGKSLVKSIRPVADEDPVALIQ
jgi:hypothetical protein